ncbi:hypothetical protein HYH02_006709 [Chlamydomonas schloesseri]|uniref:EGF-like domain-containing protein n=1 Tax=Chlamydomonas schloesseri TaxID=2026947 RepID=A0A835WI98_9CHLO|nr:hypothetical protein HYH02_006709 [Chlamydomonas schloesseri]|eukprot:KAG2448124.1 hypothetical protein HYH02_006709 [Chlamydomonas schloesseri]
MVAPGRQLLADDPQADVLANFESKCAGKCTQFGTCNEDIARCDCPKNRTGDDCSELANSGTLSSRCRRNYYPSVKECVTSELSCLNNCNKRGTCVSGWCHCKPGFFGADCSLSLDEKGEPVLLAGTGYATRAKRPWVYVYELPPDLTTWTNTKRLDRSTHIHFYQRLLGSGARIADGDKADWYYIPIRQRMTADSRFLSEAVAYISATYPWWNRTGGSRHFVIHTGDLGADETQLGARLLAPNITWLTHWGLTSDKVFSGWKKAHRPEKDVVIPVFLTPGHFKHFGLERTPLHPLMDKQPRTTTFFFAGRICGDRKPPKTGSWPNCGPRSPGYSAGVRQLVHYHHWNRPGFKVVLHEPNYGAALGSSKFCLAPLGGGHGQRQIIVSFMGCLPVCIADDVYEPFEPQYNWTAFGVRPAESDIPQLHTMLETISPKEYAAKQRALRCAAQHFVYSSITGGLFGEDGRYDAFETTLEVLRVKAEYPDAPPESYRQMDKDFDAFMDCKDPPGWKVVAPAPDLWGLVDKQAGEGEIEEEQEAKKEGSARDIEESGKRLSTGRGKSKGSGSGKEERQRGWLGNVLGRSLLGGDERAAGGDTGDAGAWVNPLCSHSIMDRKRNPCERFVTGASKTHMMPGGIVCAKTRHNLAECPRIWL